MDKKKRNPKGAGSFRQTKYGIQYRKTVIRESDGETKVICVTRKTEAACLQL